MASFGTVEEVITKENLSSIYNVEFEIMRLRANHCLYIIKFIK